MANVNANINNYSFKQISSGSDLSKRRLPYMNIQSKNPGPVLWLTGCMHGDEIGGTVVIQEIFTKLKTGLKKGVVNAFPLMNPFGFETTSRNISLSQEDLNRSFPGKNNGTFAERLSSMIFNLILETKPALVLDLHNDWTKSIPYVLLDSVGIEKNLVEKTDYFAQKTGLIRISDTELITTTLTYNLLKQGIPALTLELGESYTVNEKSIEMGCNVIWNTLNDLGMVDEHFNPFRYNIPEIYMDRILSYSPYPLASLSGIIRFLNQPGDLVKKGQRIAQIHNAFGKRIETIKALENGIILGIADYALSYPGAPIMAFGNIL
ncbi:MAG: succinylglutamate desuccinylase/aspartoacylase family protein [Spirochaetales bacterium]|nr:succinylglutamate desuccinylase/aspartoacylase family protein [Spirochaetales bacterium]